MHRTLITVITLFLATIILISCSLPPVQPVTRRELMKTRIYNKFIIDESPEELLYALNTRGEVIVEGKRNIPGKEFPVYVKLLAIADGIHLLDYDR